jgi:hypothetical protein
LSRGDFDQAEIEGAAALDGFESIDDTYGAGRALAALGSRAVHIGRTHEAVARLERSLALSAVVGDNDGMAWSLELLGAALSESQPDTAALCLGAADHLRKRLGIALEGLELTLHERTLQILNARLGDKVFATAFGVGRDQPIETTIDRARLLCALELEAADQTLEK